VEGVAGVNLPMLIRALTYREKADLAKVVKKALSGGTEGVVHMTNDSCAGCGQSVPVMETWTSPMWHRASVFLFALCCFAAEWGLRRWRGLA
jgi:hypothetical protein